MKFAWEICHKGVDPREYGYDENWEYDEKIEDAYWEEQKAIEANPHE